MLEQFITQLLVLRNEMINLFLSLTACIGIGLFLGGMFVIMRDSYKELKVK